MRIRLIARGYSNHDGYGRYAGHIARALAQAGLKVSPICLHQLTMPDDIAEMIGVSPKHLRGHDVTLCVMPGDMLNYLADEVGKVWLLSMYEATCVPDAWVRAINRDVERLIVPCEQNADAFRNSGVNVPISVIHGGTSPHEFPIIWARPLRPYTFTCMFDRGIRKGVEQALGGFYDAFGDEKTGIQDVRLIIKVRNNGVPGMSQSSFKDSRIVWWQEDVPSYATVFHRTDCFVFPSLGEGWGMPPREAAMMGLPVIATDWSGLSVGIDCWALPLRDLHLKEAMLEPMGKAQWYVPTSAEVAERMKWCYEHQSEARAFGLSAAHWLRENQTWAHTGKALKSLIESEVRS